MAFLAPMIAYITAVVAGLDGTGDELVVPYFVCQVAGFALYAYGVHQRYKRNGGD